MSVCKKYSVKAGGSGPAPSSNTMVDYNMYFGIPEIPYGMAATPGVASALNQTTTATYLACVFPVIKTGTLSKIHFKYAASNVGNAYDFRVETLDATGKPSGTLWGTNTNQTYSGISGAVDHTVTLSAGAVFNTINENFALVHRVTTYVGTGAIQAYSDGTVGDFFPYLTSTTNGGSTWAARSAAPAFGLEYSDGSFINYPGNWPITTVDINTISTATATKMVGNVINLPVKSRAVGVWVTGDQDGDFIIKLYGPDASLLQSVNVDGDLPITITTATTLTQYFSSAVTLEANTNYYLMFESSTGTNSLYNFTTLTPVPLSALNSGQVCTMVSTTTTSPTSSSNFSLSANKQLIAGLIFNGIWSGA